MRLCVDQSGERIEDKNINVLHVMANESFAEFAQTLQKEIEQETGVKFGILQISLFSGLTFTEEVTEQKKVTQSEAKQLIDYMINKGYLDEEKSTEIKQENEETITNIELSPQLESVKATVITAIEQGTAKTTEAITEAISQAVYTETKQVEKAVTYDDAQELLTHFEKKGYISKTGAIKDTMKNALMNGTLDLPQKFEAAREKFEKIISKADKKPPIRDASKDVTVRLKKEVMIDNPDFMILWNKIKQKTAYRVNVDSNLFKQRCIKELSGLPPIPKARIITKTAKINVAASGISHTETGLQILDFEEEENRLPDFLRMVDNECFVCQSLYVDILMESGKGLDFLNNPQLLIEQFIETLRSVQHNMEIEGISYRKLTGEEYYLQEIFESDELMANLDKNAVFVKNSVYDHIIYDSDTIERPFAISLDNDTEVKMFFKIPDKFKIETPIGTYNPDWAVYMDRNGEQKMYFVIETKGTLDPNQRRGEENQKIYCGSQHFKALDDSTEFLVARNWNEFKVEN